MAESEEELQSLLMKVKEESKNVDKTQHSKNYDHGIRSHHFMANRLGNDGNSERFIWGEAPKSLHIVTSAVKLKDARSLVKKLWPI